MYLITTPFTIWSSPAGLFVINEYYTSIEHLNALSSLKASIISLNTLLQPVYYQFFYCVFNYNFFYHLIFSSRIICHQWILQFHRASQCFNHHWRLQSYLLISYYDVLPLILPSDLLQQNYPIVQLVGPSILHQLSTFNNS